MREKEKAGEDVIIEDEVIEEKKVDERGEFMTEDDVSVCEEDMYFYGVYGVRPHP